jgi:hypothetical protein
MKRSRFVAAVLIGMVLTAGAAVQAGTTYGVVQSGDWSNEDIWTPWGMPVAGDVVTVTGAWNVTVDGQQAADTVYPGYGWSDNYGSMDISDPTASLTARNMWVAGTSVTARTGAGSRSGTVR